MTVPGYVRDEGVRSAVREARGERLPQWIEAELEQGRAEHAFHGLEALRSLPLFGPRVGAERELAPAPASADAEEALFWEDVQRTEAALAGYEQGASYVEWPYRHIFSGGRIVATARDARLALGPGDLLLSYFMGSQRSYVFAVRTSGMRAIPLPDAPEAQRALVADLMGRLASADPDWEASAARLYRALLGPVAGELAVADTLLVVADGPLAEVPFAVLTPGGGAPPLLERYRISSIPSFSVYLQISGRPVPNVPPRVLVVREAGAVPEGPSPASLHVFGSPTLLEGAASRSRLLQEARRHTLLLFEEASSLRAPEVASMTLPECQLVFLAEAAQALAGAFLVAGAPSVVLQRWKAGADVREALLLALFPRMLERGPVEALRQAQLALRARPATAHPHHWGAFTHQGWG